MHCRNVCFVFGSVHVVKVFFCVCFPIRVSLMLKGGCDFHLGLEFLDFTTQLPVVST